MTAIEIFFSFMLDAYRFGFLLILFAMSFISSKFTFLQGMNPDFFVLFGDLFWLFLHKLVVFNVLKFFISHVNLHTSPKIANYKQVTDSSAQETQVSQIFDR